jgi:glutathione synthase
LFRFFPDQPDVVALLRKPFAGIYDLERNGIYKEIHQKAIASPAGFVMKPQREGGGTLITGDAIPHALQTWSDDELQSHILMDRINPIPTPNVLLFSEKSTIFQSLMPSAIISKCYF